MSKFRLPPVLSAETVEFIRKSSQCLDLGEKKMSEKSLSPQDWELEIPSSKPLSGALWMIFFLFYFSFYFRVNGFLLSNIKIRKYLKNLYAAN